MFEKEAEEYQTEKRKSFNEHEQLCWGDVYKDWKNGAEFGYDKGKNEAIKHLKDLVYVVELGKNELATARILAEVKEFLKETK